MSEGKKEEPLFEEDDKNKAEDNNIQKQPEEEKKKRNRCLLKCGEEVIYAMTIIARIILTLYSFHGLFFMLNFLIQFIILVPGLLYDIDSTATRLILCLLYVFFALFASNLLIIPTYELLLFPILRYRNPIAHLESLAIVKNIIDGKEDTKKELDLNENRDWVDAILIFIELFYVIGFFCGFSSSSNIVTDLAHICVLLVIYFYYLVLFFGYIVLSFHLMIKLIKHINKRCFLEFFFHLETHINSFFDGKEPLPKINLFCYIINPILHKSYQGNNNEVFQLEFSCINKCWSITKKISRFILFLGSFILAIIVMIKKDVFSIFFFILFYGSIYFLTLMMNFPIFIRNKNTFGKFWSPKIKYKDEYKLEFPRLVSFLRLINFIIILLASLALVISFFIFDEKNSLDEISSLSFTPSTEDVKIDELLLPNICTSTVNNIPIYLYMPFINDAYYYNSNPTVSPFFYSSFQINGYKNLFFDDSFTIKAIGNLIDSKSNDNNKVKMIQYDVTKDGKEITILSIKGTSNKKDIFLDMQLYFPSVLLNLLTTFSLFGQQKDTLYFGFLEYGLSIPYRIFTQYLIVDGYLQDLLDAYYKNEKDNKFKDNVIIVGHSLGGGLCKILGRLLNKQAISLSGPGVNAFHSLWGYAGNSENFEISAIDLVPDMDLVPRVEISGGTIYRIICKEGPLDCHGKSLSLCEALIMCRNPNYKEYCTKMAELSDDQMKKISKSSELNSK